LGASLSKKIHISAFNELLRRNIKPGHEFIRFLNADFGGFALF
jgi:hypothetical protein